MVNTVLFDVNETLLDISALEPEFERIFGDGAVLQSWFLQLLQYSLVANIAGPYFDFSTIARAALQMLASARHVSLSETDQGGILNGMLLLPAHVDVPASLTRLKEAGFRLATLTNSTAAVLKQQLQNASLERFFEKNLSADEIQRYKPAPQPYHMAAEELRTAVHEMCLVSAHPWDVLGAMRAGYRAAFVARRGQIFYPLASKPDIVGADLDAVSAKILSRESI